MSDLHVAFGVGEAEYVLPALDIVQMAPFEGATRVPETPPWVAGLVQIRGAVLPVIDLRARFGLEPQAPTLGSRVIVVREGERSLGLLADRAREVVRVPSEAFEAPPELVARQAEGWVRAVAQVDGRLLMLLDVRKVIGEERLDGDQAERA